MAAVLTSRRNRTRWQAARCSVAESAEAQGLLVWFLKGNE